MLEPEFNYYRRGPGAAGIPNIWRRSDCGLFCRECTISDGAKVRFLREGTIIWKGEGCIVTSLQDPANQVTAGMECGIGCQTSQTSKKVT